MRTESGLPMSIYSRASARSFRASEQAFYESTIDKDARQTVTRYWFGFGWKGWGELKRGGTREFLSKTTPA
jgi:hypothetical protein